MRETMVTNQPYRLHNASCEVHWLQCVSPQADFHMFPHVSTPAAADRPVIYFIELFPR